MSSNSGPNSAKILSTSIGSGLGIIGPLRPPSARHLPLLLVGQLRTGAGLVLTPMRGLSLPALRRPMVPGGVLSGVVVGVVVDEVLGAVLAVRAGLGAGPLPDRAHQRSSTSRGTGGL